MYGRRAVLPIDIEMNGINYEIAVKSESTIFKSGKTPLAIIAALNEQCLEILQVAKMNIQKAQKRQKCTYH